jgi:membrane associated rhomboid family serine protease
MLGAYLVLYPRVRVDVLLPLPFLFSTINVPAFLMLLCWIAIQLVSALPQLSTLHRETSSGVAFFAHLGGFLCGALLVKLFASRERVATKTAIRHELHPEHA